MYFEDYVVGLTVELAPIDVTLEEIIEFAQRYDPQPFHVDEVAAVAGPFGGLVASGWHTCALVMRSMVEGYLYPESSLGGSAANDLRWPVPVRPGDRLRVQAEVLSARVSRTRPDRGIVETRLEAHNQRDEVALMLTTVSFVRRGPRAD
jgi:acyl dehydratase